MHWKRTLLTAGLFVGAWIVVKAIKLGIVAVIVALVVG